MNNFSGVHTYSRHKKRRMFRFVFVLCLSFLLLCKTKKVVVFGGTGRTGQTVIQKLMAEPSVSLFTLLRSCRMYHLT